MNDFVFDENKEIEKDIEGEEIGEIEALTSRKLHTDKSDRSLPDLVRMINNNALNLSPDYQRDFIWNVRQQSKFIESLILGIPVPTVFLSENDDSTYEVIDGQQRLTTLKRFWNNELELKGLETLTEHNGMRFESLNQTIKNILENTRTISVVTIGKDSTPDIKFDIFQRINEGAVRLSAQELRNVVYRGPIIEMLKNLSELEIWMKYFNRNGFTVKRKYDQEIILRMLAMDDLIEDNGFELEISRYNGRLNNAMITFLEKYRNDQVAIEKFKVEFEVTLKKIDKYLPENIKLRLPYVSNYRALNGTVSEFQYILMKRINESYLIDNQEGFAQKLQEILKSNETLFIRATGNSINLRERLKLISELINDVKR